MEPFRRRAALIAGALALAYVGGFMALLFVTG